MTQMYTPAVIKVALAGRAVDLLSCSCDRAQHLERHRSHA